MLEKNKFTPNMYWASVFISPTSSDSAFVYKCSHFLYLPYKVTDEFYIFKIFGKVMNTKAALDFALWLESCVYKACSANKYGTEQPFVNSTAVRVEA